MPQTRGLLSLISLESLDSNSLAASLAAVDGQLATCAACPAVALETLREAPPLCAYLERCLELTRENRGLGPAPAVLLLQVCSGSAVLGVGMGRIVVRGGGWYSQTWRPCACPVLHAACAGNQLVLLAALLSVPHAACLLMLLHPCLPPPSSSCNNADCEPSEVR